MSNFPTSLDDATSLPNPTGTSKQNNPDHGSLHTSENQAIIALEGKLGIGSSTPTANKFMFSTGTGTSAWTQVTSSQLASSISDETGTGSAVFATTPTLVTPKVDTINENTSNNGVTIDGLNIKDGALTTANSLPTGAVVQVVATNFSAVATGTTLTPYDDTIPQITEGTEFMTQAITPKSTTNRLFIEVEAYVSNSVVNETIGALFQDTTTNALAGKVIYGSSSTGETLLRVSHDMVAGTISSTTFRFRVGPSTAATITFNGRSGSRRLGGITLSTIKITEYKA